MENGVRYKEAKKVTIIGGILNAFLGFIKVVGGLFFHSHALVADGIHSFSDLLADILVLFASKYGSQDADHSHPYGHQRIETAATFMLSLFLILAGTGIAWDSFTELLDKYITKPSYISLVIALFSIFTNEALFHYTRRIGKKIRSELIIANAWHHRSDAAASIVVLVGLIGSIAGFHYLDAVAAIIVGCMIIKMGWDYGWNSVKELVDSAVEPELLKKIKNTIMSVDGVIKIHQLRSRMMGPDIYIDVHILVDPYISVSEGHFIAQHVHDALMNDIEHVKDVVVHVDPEDDEVNRPSLKLPNRSYLEKHFIQEWQQNIPTFKTWLIHYLDGKLTIDIFVNGKLSEKEKNYLRIALTNQYTIVKVRVFQEIASIALAK
ncbi:cation efflux family protein (plasmid) [Legionella adelaidensis]|uniref:Cation efflux family protein n=1 Tax=Legionella adelaidensis TaxID=45056 RepID=A0A0W0R635_9GAMM|nr:cation diffusion facilitator family transporter [Legionella adelaidensis]KTC66506.1 cation efflux family protein [Legionella adelaidensis]VEH85797.1 cation efflux family protein [Legionella adelaidensis]